MKRSEVTSTSKPISQVGLGKLVFQLPSSHITSSPDNTQISCGRVIEMISISADQHTRKTPLVAATMTGKKGVSSK